MTKIRIRWRSDARYNIILEPNFKPEIVSLARLTHATSVVELLRHHAPTFNELDLYHLGHLNKSLTPGRREIWT